jgi:hypothetical protein
MTHILKGLPEKVRTEAVDALQVVEGVQVE